MCIFTHFYIRISLFVQQRLYKKTANFSVAYQIRIILSFIHFDSVCSCDEDVYLRYSFTHKLELNKTNREDNFFVFFNLHFLLFIIYHFVCYWRWCCAVKYFNQQKCDFFLLLLINKTLKCLWSATTDC